MDIIAIISQGPRVIRMLNSFLWRSKHWNKKEYKVIFESIKLYESEDWTISRRQLEIFKAT